MSKLDNEHLTSPNRKAARKESTETEGDGERKRARISEAKDGSQKIINPGNGEVETELPCNSTGADSVDAHKSRQAGVRASGNDNDNERRGSNSLRNTVITTLTGDVAEDRGSRHTMEDAWVLLPQAWLGTPGKLRLAHFAIYDGHGGRHAAEYARAHLHANVLSAGLPRESVDIKGVRKAIVEGFKNTDEALLRESTTGGWQDGATVVSVWVLGQTVFVANLGDAKAVLARAPVEGNSAVSSNSSAQIPSDVKDAPLKGVIVTKEHKAIFPLERARIEKVRRVGGRHSYGEEILSNLARELWLKTGTPALPSSTILDSLCGCVSHDILLTVDLLAGGFVEPNGRLLGRLEVSRAFGDRNFKKAGVISVPDIQKFELTERERFLILGCDGLWGVFGASDAVEFVAGQLKDGSTVGVACRRLIREAVRERKYAPVSSIPGNTTSCYTYFVRLCQRLCTLLTMVI